MLCTSLVPFLLVLITVWVIDCGGWGEVGRTVTEKRRMLVLPAFSVKKTKWFIYLSCQTGHTQDCKVYILTNSSFLHLTRMIKSTQWQLSEWESLHGKLKGNWFTGKLAYVMILWNARTERKWWGRAPHHGKPLQQTTDIKRAPDHLRMSGEMKVWSRFLGISIPTSNAPHIRVVWIQHDGTYPGGV